MDNAHEPIISKEPVRRGAGSPWQAAGTVWRSGVPVQASACRPHLLRPLRRQILPTEHRQVFLLRPVYSRTKQMKSMVKDPNCMNKIWKGAELEAIVDAQIRELLSSPEMAAEIATSRSKPAPVSKNAEIEKRLREIDKQIGKLMELYQHDDYTARASGRAYQQALQRAHRVGIHPCPGGRG